jgi:hypothetical protein
MPTPEELNEQQARAQEGVTASARESSTALDDLTAAARRADQTFASGILSVPRTLGDAVARVTGDTLATPIRFFEARFQTLQRLTDYGINFNYSMRGMETAANDARMELGDLANIVKSSNDQLTMLGVGANDGIQNFTNLLANAYTLQYKFGNDIETNLRRLGFSTEELRESFLDYNTILAYSRSNEIRSTTQRNLQAAEYAELLDDISNLTGKRRDQISDEIVQAARQGNVQARAAQLPVEMRDQYTTFLGSMRAQFGQNIGDLTEDLLGPGAGQTSTTRLLQGQMQAFSRTMHQLRRLYEDPNASPQEIARLESLARAQAAQTSELNRSGLAVWNRVTDAGGVISDTMTQTAQAQAVYAEAEERLRSQRGAGARITPAEIAQEVSRLNQERRDRAQRNAPANSELASYQQFISNQIALERGQQRARALTIDFAYDNFSTVVTETGELVEDFVNGLFGPEGDLQKAFNRFQGWINDVSGGSEIVRGNAAARAAQERAYGLQAEGIRLAGELQDIRQQLSDPNLTEARRLELLEDRSRVMDQIRELGVSNMIVNAQAAAIQIDNPDSVDILSRVPGSEAAQSGAGGTNAIGTMGTIGRLFKDFGEESLVRLHGIESVQTPAQVAEVMRMSSMGTMQALADSLTNQGSGRETIAQIRTVARTNTTVLDSMLNSFRNNMRDIATRTETSPTIEPDVIIREIMNQLPRQLRTSLEDAITSTLKPSLDSLVTVNTAAAESSDQIRRHTRNINRDYMRGV